ncbi:MAG: hypothetical protein J1E29_08940 [Duncaniella sp.]|nr:hypothetical protein [Duncaniella sp.]
MTRTSASSLLSTLGLLAILAASALPLLRLGGEWFGWLYAAGAALLLAARFIDPTPAGASLRVKRLKRMEIWTALIFVAGAVFTFLDLPGNDWLAFTMAGGVLTIYTSVMIPRESRKSENS